MPQQKQTRIKLTAEVENGLDALKEQYGIHSLSTLINTILLEAIQSQKEQQDELSK